MIKRLRGFLGEDLRKMRKKEKVKEVLQKLNFLKLLLKACGYYLGLFPAQDKSWQTGY